MKNSLPDVRWVKYGNVHLTLKILGDMDVSKIDAIGKALQDIAGSFHHRIESCWHRGISKLT